MFDEPFDKRYGCRPGHVGGRVAFEGKTADRKMEDFDQLCSYLEGREKATLMGA